MIVERLFKVVVKSRGKLITQLISLQRCECEKYVNTRVYLTIVSLQKAPADCESASLMLHLAMYICVYFSYNGKQLIALVISFRIQTEQMCKVGIY